ncbi:MAG: AAA family ATPase [Saprospiraceae bacterium]
MLKKLTFSNYKLFKTEQELELKPMTILIGKNSSGKSSITKLMPLLEDAFNGQNIGFALGWENQYVSLGTSFRDLLYAREPIGELNFRFESEHFLEIDLAADVRSRYPKILRWKLNDEYDLKYVHSVNRYSHNQSKELLSYKYIGFNLNIEKKLPNLKDYGIKLKANYIGPYRFIPKSLIELQPFKTNDKLGKDGEEIYQFLVEDDIDNEGIILNKVSQWYRENFEGWGIKVNYDKQPDYYELELYRDNPKLNINFKEVGQGMIQALPLIGSSFIPNDNSDLINVFEQPELHLHPAAHGNIAERFAMSTIELNKRYLIETHSQNFVLRLRRLIAEKKFDKNNLVIYYVDYDEEKGESNLKRINVDEQGSVDFWPQNVFSETLDETLAIRTAQIQNPYVSRN